MEKAQVDFTVVLCAESPFPGNMNQQTKATISRNLPLYDAVCYFRQAGFTSHYFHPVLSICICIDFEYWYSNSSLSSKQTCGNLSRNYCSVFFSGNTVPFRNTPASQCWSLPHFVIREKTLVGTLANSILPHRRGWSSPYSYLFYDNMIMTKN